MQQALHRRASDTGRWGSSIQESRFLSADSPEYELTYRMFGQASNFSVNDSQFQSAQIIYNYQSWSQIHAMSTSKQTFSNISKFSYIDRMVVLTHRSPVQRLEMGGQVITVVKEERVDLWAAIILGVTTRHLMESVS